MEDKIRVINQVLKKYFEKHPTSAPIPAKDFMDSFISAGVFPKDTKKGLPIRNFLRSLDRQKLLGKIPYILADRKSVNTKWYFAPSSKPGILHAAEAKDHWKNKLSVPKPKAQKERDNSVEAYIISLCDQVVGKASARQHRFPFLLGDPGKSGKRTMLPVDAWYESLNLVVEYHELQHTGDVALFDKRQTVSGVSQKEQRRIYDKRREKLLPQNGKELIIFDYTDFPHDGRKRLIREINQDIFIITTRLKNYI